MWNCKPATICGVWTDTSRREREDSFHGEKCKTKQKSLKFFWFQLHNIYVVSSLFLFLGIKVEYSFSNYLLAVSQTNELFDKHMKMKMDLDITDVFVLYSWSNLTDFELVLWNTESQINSVELRKTTLDRTWSAWNVTHPLKIVDGSDVFEIQN